jgi:hypothetical protein
MIRKYLLRWSQEKRHLLTVTELGAEPQMRLFKTSQSKFPSSQPFRDRHNTNALTHQHINTDTATQFRQREHTNASQQQTHQQWHQHINTSTHQHIQLPHTLTHHHMHSHQHITHQLTHHQHISTSTRQHINTVINTSSQS